MFYRHTTKSFVPLNERWAEYLISLSETSEGKGVPISERINTRRQLNLQSLVNPPDVMTARKYASVATVPADLKQLAQSGWEDIKTAATAALTDEVPQESILRKFITRDGGYSAISKIACAARNDADFAQALFLASSAENYMPDLEPLKAPEPQPLLTLHMQAHKNANVKSASAEDLNKGYVFEDARPKEALNEAVYEACDRTLRSVTEPGVYQVLTADGSMREMVCAYHHHLFERANPAVYMPVNMPCQALLPFAVVDTGDNRTKDLDALSPATKVLGKFERDIKASDGVATPEAKKMYRVLNLKTRTLSEPFYVESVNKKDLGMTSVKLQNRWHDHAEAPEVSMAPLILLISRQFFQFTSHPETGLICKREETEPTRSKYETWIQSPANLAGSGPVGCAQFGLRHAGPVARHGGA